jgi:hypothetical protein
MTSTTFTARLRKLAEEGAVVVASVAPFDGHPVEYRPRKHGDPTPWILIGKPEDSYYRFAGRFCHETWPNGKPQRKLGASQKHCLEAMTRYSGTWANGSGWVWGNRSKTLTIMKALEKRGLVVQTSTVQFREAFELTEAGWVASGKTEPKFDNAR